MTDPHDPLAGLDPFPRARIDGLHRERTELLEEIVSTPGPGKQPASTRAKVFVAGGIAAALAIVGGGVWAVSSGGGASDETTVTSADSTPTPTVDPSETPSATTAPTPSPSPNSPRHRRRALTESLQRLERCARVLDGDLANLQELSELLDEGTLRVRRPRRHDGWVDIHVGRKCRVIQVQRR